LPYTIPLNKVKIIILVYFRKENSIKLDKLIAFINLGNELILKKKDNIIISRYLVFEIPS
jgi:hypothetical protein